MDVNASFQRRLRAISAALSGSVGCATKCHPARPVPFPVAGPPELPSSEHSKARQATVRLRGWSSGIKLSPEGRPPRAESMRWTWCLTVSATLCRTPVAPVFVCRFVPSTPPGRRKSRLFDVDAGSRRPWRRCIYRETRVILFPVRTLRWSMQTAERQRPRCQLWTTTPAPVPACTSRRRRYARPLATAAAPPCTLPRDRRTAVRIDQQQAWHESIVETHGQTTVPSKMLETREYQILHLSRTLKNSLADLLQRLRAAPCSLAA